MHYPYTTLDIFVKVSQILGFASLAVTVYFGVFRYKQYYLTSYKQHIDTVFRCNSRYEKLVIEFLRINNNKKAKEQEWELTSNLAIAKLIIELFDEQLFYISQRIVPEKIALNWISKMIDFFENEQMCLTKVDNLALSYDEILKNTCMFKQHMFSPQNLFAKPKDIYAKLTEVPAPPSPRPRGSAPATVDSAQTTAIPTGYRN